MEKYKVLQIDPKDGWQRVQVLRADGKKIWASDSSYHPFEVGKSYEGDFAEKDNVKDGRTYHNYYFGVILPAEEPLATEASQAAEYADNGRDERIMRGNALNAAAAALGPLIAVRQGADPDLELDNWAAALTYIAARLVPFLRGETAAAVASVDAPPRPQEGAEPPQTQKQRVQTTPTVCPGHNAPYDKEDDRGAYHFLLGSAGTKCRA